MLNLSELKREIQENPQYWHVPFMDFVDEFRSRKDLRAISEPFEIDGSQIDALLASTVEYLCDEAGIVPPDWLSRVPACERPFFVSGLESLKAIAIVESPLRFRIRKVFVHENFLNRV